MAKFLKRPVLIQPILGTIRKLSDSGRLGGVLLVLATILSICITNSRFGESYLHFWHKEIGNAFLSMHVEHWVNDLLMAIFFFMVGMEIKREMMIGELSSIKKSLLPIFAALGGMLFPALIYFLFNHNTEYVHGWAIPTATDIAFSLGVLSLLGSRVPMSLKVFLTALAIIDDLGGIIIIAVFYTNDIHLNYLLLSAIVLLLLLILNQLKTKSFIIYFIPMLVLWYFVYKSGVHATIAGVLSAMFIPLGKIEKYERVLHQPVNYLILPIFALANTTIALSADSLQHIFMPVSLGIILALLLGKPLGISCFVYLSLKFKLGALQDNSDIKDIFAVSLLAGIGFTVALFFTALSFKDVESANIARLAILIGSTLSAVFGMLLLSRTIKDNNLPS
ncbi:MAG: Na+/H+ antiporter NhaA [Chitinophagales bacterium]|nr:Na+/H+ antiporter NhaA [Bacteroidota bacterium]